jgi:hypothetical protein
MTKVKKNVFCLFYGKKWREKPNFLVSSFDLPADLGSFLKQENLAGTKTRRGEKTLPKTLSSGQKENLHFPPGMLFTGKEASGKNFRIVKDQDVSQL